MMQTRNEKSPPMAGLSLISYDDEGGVTPRPHAPFNNNSNPDLPSLSMNVPAIL